MWTDVTATTEQCRQLQPFQHLNHFPGMGDLCRKDLLARNLTRMRKEFPDDYKFFPRTWVVI